MLPTLFCSLGILWTTLWCKTRLVDSSLVATCLCLYRIILSVNLQGLLAAHRGGYMESSLREEGPAPLLWRPSEFKHWAQLCSSEPEIGHALMRLVIGGRDIPYSCEVNNSTS